MILGDCAAELSGRKTRESQSFAHNSPCITEPLNNCRAYPARSTIRVPLDVYPTLSQRFFIVEYGGQAKSSEPLRNGPPSTMGKPVVPINNASTHYLRPSSLPPYSNLDPGSQSRYSLLPPPHCSSCLAFCCWEKTQPILPLSTRVELRLITLGSAVDFFCLHVN